MNIVIIEDEIKAAKSLANMITAVRPAAQVVATLQSIESAVSYFSGNEMPDLVFMDIQLSDGLCFEIFTAVRLRCPVVFCTAYGEYAMEAIKANGIDYILKPFAKEEVQKAFEKVDNLKNFFQQHEQPDLNSLFKKAGLQEGKKSFLVFKDNKYVTVPTDQIAFIYIRYDTTTIMTFQKQTYPLTQSLEQVQEQLSPQQFYRLNRQYLINFSAVKEVEHYSARKLFVKLVVPAPDELLIGKEKTTAFLEWLGDR
ncbi:response regulator transcription factor [Pseudoflavitalea sp. X16]|uniref:LytR/AlgR family response regulator transcription factor n=1 Tax=Paraflavitalea devenefica TaxID=2716334 RepID=UPI001422194C|nr:LytTR family DNA-binding domain-containing protein [Paraflavitalea devenefica]NII29330.1 response regulator transcription factor [Paraflavitalea devenefica]